MFFLPFHSPKNVSILKKKMKIYLFWNQILTCLSDNWRVVAISIRLLRVRYRLKWNSFSENSSCYLLSWWESRIAKVKSRPEIKPQMCLFWSLKSTKKLTELQSLVSRICCSDSFIVILSTLPMRVFCCNFIKIKIYNFGISYVEQNASAASTDRSWAISRLDRICSRESRSCRGRPDDAWAPGESHR